MGVAREMKEVQADKEVGKGEVIYARFHLDTMSLGFEIAKDRERSLDEIIGKLVEQADIAENLREAASVEIHEILLRAKSEVARPKWHEREKYLELAKLSAPKFLTEVHAENIKNNTVVKRTIRGTDPDLMDAVETYISQRKARGQNLGDAKGLKFVSTRHPGSKTSIRAKLRKTFGKQADDIVEGIRKVEREQKRKQRARRRQIEPK